MVSHCTAGLLVLGSQKDEEWGGDEGRGGSRSEDGLAKQHLTWLQLRAINFQCVGRVQCLCVPSVCGCARLCLHVCVLHMSKHFCLSEPAGSTVVSGVPALGDETDRIKTHHNTAVIFP